VKLAILSRNPSAYSTRRLREASVRRGHRAVVLDTLRFGLLVEAERPDLSYRSRPLSRYDAAIPRIGASISVFGAAVVRQLEQLGVTCLNGATAIALARDKLHSLQLLSRNGIPIPVTSFVCDPMDVLPAIERVGGAPVMIKVQEGSQGAGVILAETPTVAKAIVETLQMAQKHVLIQRFVRESRGRDLRAFVVGTRVVAAVARSNLGDEFRSNVHRGGHSKAIELDVLTSQTAVRAAGILGLEVAGVDLIEGDEGPQVLEVNASPGLEGIERATGADLAAAIVEHLEGLIPIAKEPGSNRPRAREPLS
jgi:ribosomal protein S6--L-glutamate ligase